MLSELLHALCHMLSMAVMVSSCQPRVIQAAVIQAAVIQAAVIPIPRDPVAASCELPLVNLRTLAHMAVSKVVLSCPVLGSKG